MKRITSMNGVPTLIDDEDGTVLEQPFWKTPYNFNFDDEVTQTSTTTPEPTLTDQSFQDETDINTIVKKIGLGLNNIPPLSPDMFGIDERISYVEIAAHMAQHKANFYNLPPDIREEFLNDPARWTDQVVKLINTKKFDELDRLGIETDDLRNAAEPPPAAPQPTPAAGAPAAAPPTGGPPTT